MEEQYDYEPYSPKPKPETPWVAPTMKIGVYKRKNGRYQVYFSHEGKQIHLQRLPWGKPLDSNTDVALLKAYLRKMGYHPEKWGKELAFQFDHCIQTWIKSSNASQERIQHLRQITNKFFIPHFRKMDIRKIQTAHIQEFYATLLEKKYSPKYCKNIMGELHTFLNFYKKSLTLFPDFPKIEVQEPVIRWLTEEDQARIFQRIPEADRPIFELMRHYGCRTNEAGGLLRQNVFLDHTPPYFVVASTLRKNGEVKPVTKTKKIRILPIVDETRWIFETRGESPFLFTKKGRPYTNKRLNSVWNRANRASGVTQINLYNGVRHSFACQRLNAGYSIEEVRVILGHSSSKMTQRYAQYTLKSLENIVRGNIYTPFITTPDIKLIENKGSKQPGDRALHLAPKGEPAPTEWEKLEKSP